MRMTIIALSMLPFAAFAEGTTEADINQSCPVGMVWDGSAQNCTLASNDTSPLGGMDGHVGCHGDAAREVTS